MRRSAGDNLPVLMMAGDSMDLLTVKEVAEFYSRGERWIRQLIQSGDIYAQEHPDPANNKKQYLVPVKSLPEDLQRKYYARLKAEMGAELAPQPVKRQRQPRPARPFDEYSAAEREQIQFWTRTLQAWQEFRGRYARKTDADIPFVTLFKINHKEVISPDILYRKWAAYREGDLEGLLDHRGGWNRGKTGMHPQVWSAFLWFYWDDRRPPLSQSYQITREWVKEFYPEWESTLESERTFRRRYENEIPKAVDKLMRYGEKACYDECLPYIEREYAGIEANDVWIADNHTLDITSQRDGESTTHRLHITGFMDAKSGVLVGWNITDNPCSQSTIFALRHGILRFGAPRIVLFDNGTEFLCYDIAGRGYRTRKSTSMIERPPAILTRLGIEMKNAQVRNARAKPIERFFLTFKNTISKLFDTYTGGNVLEKPESLKDKLKGNKVPLDSRLREIVADLIDGLYNVGQYGGGEKMFSGFSRLEVWNESIQNREIRKATEDELSLMLMRTTNYQKVKRKGVCLDYAGTRLWYADEHTWQYLDEQVYVRYNPEDMSSVRVYDKEDRFMFTLPMDDELRLGFLEDDKDKLATANERLRHSKKAVKEYAKGMITLTAAQRIDALDIRIRQARAAKEGMLIKEPKRIIPIMANEKPLLEAVGQNAEGVVVDMKKMNKHAGLRRDK